MTQQWQATEQGMTGLLDHLDPPPPEVPESQEEISVQEWTSQSPTAMINHDIETVDQPGETPAGETAESMVERAISTANRALGRVESEASRTRRSAIVAWSLVGTLGLFGLIGIWYATSTIGELKSQIAVEQTKNSETASQLEDTKETVAILRHDLTIEKQQLIAKDAQLVTLAADRRELAGDLRNTEAELGAVRQTQANTNLELTKLQSSLTTLKLMVAKDQQQAQAGFFDQLLGKFGN